MAAVLWHEDGLWKVLCLPGLLPVFLRCFRIFGNEGTMRKPLCFKGDASSLFLRVV